MSTLNKLLLLPYIYHFHYVCTIDREGEGDEVRIYIWSEQSQVGVGGGRLGGYLLGGSGSQDGRTPYTGFFEFFFSFDERLLHERANINSMISMFIRIKEG
jgi:hypothetical protein